MSTLTAALVFLSAALAGPFAVESSPGEGIPTFTATQSFEVPVYSAFSGGEKAGACQVTDGQKVAYTSSVVVTQKPVSITLPSDKGATVQSYGATELLTQTHYYEGGQEAALHLTAGSTVEVLAYRAEGACLFRANNDVFQADCSAFAVEPAELPTEWWIQARCEGAAGWVKVSDIQDFTREDREF